MKLYHILFGGMNYIAYLCIAKQKNYRLMEQEIKEMLKELWQDKQILKEEILKGVVFFIFVFLFGYIGMVIATDQYFHPWLN